MKPSEAPGESDREGQTSRVQNTGAWSPRFASAHPRAASRLPAGVNSPTGMTQALVDLSALLHRAEVDDALRYLNGRVRFRFTGIFRIAPPTLINLRLFDRENPRLNVSGNIAPVDTGYCGICCATNAPFATWNAQRDPRVESHPASTSMLSYAGVPLRTPNGVAWGTLCHFDLRPRLVRESELTIFHAAAPLFEAWARTAAIPT